jgi:Pin2-interacting protein X1
MGLQGDGLTSHLKVSQKLNMLGIGAQHAKDPNGLAWKQNRDFERLLARLNGAQGGEDPGTAVGGFARAEEESMIGEVEMDAVTELEFAEGSGEGETKKEKKKRKEARDAEADDPLGGPKAKKRRHSKEDGEPAMAVVEETVVVAADPAPAPAPKPSAGPPRGYVSILHCASTLCSDRVPHLQASQHRLFVIVYLLKPIVCSINYTSSSQSPCPFHPRKEACAL